MKRINWNYRWYTMKNVKNNASELALPTISSIFSNNDLTFLQIDKVAPTTARYFYNGGIVRNDDKTIRLFYRMGYEPKMMHDVISTCLLTNEYIPISGTHRRVITHSDSKLVMENLKLVFKQHIKNIKDGEHCEDPRAIKHNGAWFVTYTDGFRVGVAKLDGDTCDTIYTHYLETPRGTSNTDSDGREKNWIPFSNGNDLLMLYSDTPRRILHYIDSGDRLTLKEVGPIGPTTTCSFGSVRGGCPPVEFDDKHLIWFFHTGSLTRPYCIGAYITEGYEKVICVVDIPILSGVPREKKVIDLTIKDYIVYPCGAICTASGWDICLGVCDYVLAILSVSKVSISKYISV